MRIAMVGLLGLMLAGMAQRVEAVSQAGAISLQFPVGSRYNALGEAGTALATDATALWWNPGGFAFASSPEAEGNGHLMYSPLATGLAEDVNITWLGGGKYMPGWGMVGGTFTYLNQGQQTHTDEGGTELGTFRAYQFALSVGIGVRVSENLGVGFGAKFFRDQLAPDSALQAGQGSGSGSGQSYGMDIGARYELNDIDVGFTIPQVAVGISYTNFGLNAKSFGFDSEVGFDNDITFDDASQSDPMPVTLRLGGAIKAFDSEVASLTGVVDYLQSVVKDDETWVVGGGVEAGYVNVLFVRFGYKYDPEGKIENFTGGGGVDLTKVAGVPVSFDYATVPQADDLERVHRFSFDVRF